MKNIIIIIALLIGVSIFSQEKKYATYRVTDNETITSIAKKLGITPYDLLKLNPDAKNGIDIDEVIIIPNKNYKSITPLVKKIKVERFSYKDSIKDGILYHRVKFGETIYSLARKYKVKKKKVLRLNNLKKRSKISINQLLKFPTNKVNTFSKITEEVTISETQNEFLTYIVKADDTKYSLARNHHISVIELEKINPYLKNKTLNEYDEILLPNLAYIIKEIDGVSNEISTTQKLHTVQSQETFFKLTRLYHVTKEELIALNPELINGLKEGMLIKIPNIANDIIFGKPKFKIHTVVVQETLYGLAKLYNISEEELITINPELKDGLKEGMLIKIPSRIIIENLLNLDNNFTGKTIEVALMLPFKAKEKNNTTFKEDKNVNRITDFYLGSLLAMDDLKKQGLSIKLNVFDTKGDKTVVSNIINTGNFSTTNVIIGPLHYSNIEQISKMFRDTQVPIISPVSNNDHSALRSKNIIQNIATKKQLKNRMLHFIKDSYTNQNIIIITDEEKESKFKVAQLVTELKLHDSIRKVTILNVKDGYIKREKFIENISNKKENWVILASNDKTTTSITVDNLGVFSEKFKITLFGLNKGKNFKNIKNSFLNRLNFHYPTNEFIEKNNNKVLIFKENYKLKYGNQPSSFSFKGYDTVYDALLRIATYQNINDAFQKGKTKGLSSDFNYKTSMFSSPVNNHIFIVKYKEFEIVKVE